MEWVISCSDVEKHPRYNKENPKENLEGILYSYGMDVSKGYYTDERDRSQVPEDWPEDEPHFGYSHRSPFTGEIAVGPRYLGVARYDGNWGRFVKSFIALGGEV
jgi:hypothetical protein